MSIEVRIPPLGESVLEGTINQWIKHEGDPVAAGDPLLGLDTEKVNVEVTAEAAGVLEKILRKEGDTVRVGEVVATIAGAAAAAAGKAPPERPETTDPTRPSVPPPSAAPAPAAPAPAAPAAAAPPAAASPAVPAPAEPAPAEPAPADAPLANPSARRMAAEEGISLRDVTGTGPGGRPASSGADCPRAGCPRAGRFHGRFRREGRAEPAFSQASHHCAPPG